MNTEIQGNSSGWLFYVKASFALAIIAMALGIIFMPADLLAKGYMALCGLFLMSSTITLSKTMRDEHESSRLINKISEAKTNQILKEYSE